MAKSLDFNKVKKSFLTVTLNDEDKTTLLITTPTKAILDEFVEIQDQLGSANDETEILGELFKICAKIMSRNKANIEVTSKQLEELFDFEDIMLFINAYTAFIKEVTNVKN